MKLIDASLLADEVSKEYREQKQLYDETGYNERFGIVRGLGKASEIIAKQPIVDAAPVAHGEWEQPEYEDEDNGEYRCSVCGTYFCMIDGTPEENEYHFCPHCGAKMDA